MACKAPICYPKYSTVGGRLTNRPLICHAAPATLPHVKTFKVFFCKCLVASSGSNLQNVEDHYMACGTCHATACKNVESHLKNQIKLMHFDVQSKWKIILNILISRSLLFFSLHDQNDLKFYLTFQCFSNKQG